MTDSMEKINEDIVLEDPRFHKGITLFNSQDWYLAHDIFEELWHETYGPERQTIQGILQIAVAQLHLERGNLNGATILYGEGLGRLKGMGIPDLGLDIKSLCSTVEARLKFLQKKNDLKECKVPSLNKKP
tara:strand:+ start:307 stop:696 length:390 start_codon:yes stop_codon:yes gene_type:complete